MEKEIEKIFIDILSRELDIPQIYGYSTSGDAIPAFTIGHNDAKLGRDPRLQIAITQLGNPKVMSSVVKADFTVDPPQEIQTVRAQTNIQIDMMSKNRDAISRGLEVIGALSSFYSQMKQEKYFFKIFSIPTGFTNTSQVEGEGSLNRYTITVVCHQWYKKSKNLDDYYQQFSTRVDNDTTISEEDGLIELEEGEAETP